MGKHKLFTKEIERHLQAQFSLGSSFDQKVIAKIFNPYGRGTWYLINQDPDDPDYLWALVDLFEVEIGSVSKSELENFRIQLGHYQLPLERDLYFKPKTVAEIYHELNK